MAAPIRKTVVWMIAVMVLVWNNQSYAGLPDGLMIVAYDGNAWFPYIINNEDKGWLKIIDVKNPSNITWQKKSGRFLIKGDDGKLYQYKSDTKELKHLEQFDNTNNTHLRAHSNGFDMVQLVGGKSLNTNIVSIDVENKAKVAVRQMSAQFHPYRHGDQLFYANVSCRIECKPLIQEVWLKDLVTGNCKQLTLLNATSYLFSVDKNSQFGFISSNQQGYYHLARLDLRSGEIVWLTDGHVTDGFPSIAPDGSLYFFRRTASGGHLMRLAKQAVFGRTVASNDAFEIVELPEEIKKIRYLEISN